MKIRIFLPAHEFVGGHTLSISIFLPGLSVNEEEVPEMKCKSHIRILDIEKPFLHRKRLAVEAGLGAHWKNLQNEVKADSIMQ